MSVKRKFGLRGKLSMIILLVVVMLSAAINFYTSSYLAGATNKECMHRAELVASFIETSLVNNEERNFTTHVQGEIEEFVRSNNEIKKISIDAPNDGFMNASADSFVSVIASTDKEIIGKRVVRRQLQLAFISIPAPVTA